jgi:hypothetical protein
MVIEVMKTVQTMMGHQFRIFSIENLKYTRPSKTGDVGMTTNNTEDETKLKKRMKGDITLADSSSHRHMSLTSNISRRVSETNGMIEDIGSTVANHWIQRSHRTTKQLPSFPSHS